MSMSPRRRLVSSLLAGALAAAALSAGGAPPVAAADPQTPQTRALARLAADADGAVEVVRDETGDVTLIGVPASTDLDLAAITPTTPPATAAAAVVDRYGAALGAARTGTTLERTAVQPTSAGDVVRYQQQVDGVPVVGGELVVNLREDRELASVLANVSEQTKVAGATVTEAEAEVAARDAFAKVAGTSTANVQVHAEGRWLLDPRVLQPTADGTSDGVGTRAVWRFEVTREAHERRLLLVDDRSGDVLVNADMLTEALDRVVCDANDLKVAHESVCASGFARVEGAPRAASPT